MCISVTYKSEINKKIIYSAGREDLGHAVEIQIFRPFYDFSGERTKVKDAEHWHSSCLL